MIKKLFIFFLYIYYPIYKLVCIVFKKYVSNTHSYVNYLNWESLPIKLLCLVPYLTLFTLKESFLPFIVFLILSLMYIFLRTIEYLNPKIIS